MKIYRLHVLISTDSRSILRGALEIEAKLKEEIKKQGLENEVQILRTGGWGVEEGVQVTVYPGGLIYILKDEDDIPFLVTEHFLKGRPVKKLLFEIEAPPRVEAPPTVEEEILRKQTRLVLRNVGLINPDDIKEYIAQDGYQALAKALTSMKPGEIIQVVKDAELWGRGGAGFPTGFKWELTAKSPNTPKYIICNADEGEPGTFKDRVIMEGDPHSIIEAMTISGFATGATKGYIYVRGEYDLSILRLNRAIEQAREYGLLGENILGSGFSFDIEVRNGAGSYVCGEETALIESLEGKRGEPRFKPPYPSTVGLWGKPTVVNNVETLANILLIVLKGADWYKNLGVEDSRGTKVATLFGDVNVKGVIEVPFGYSLRDLVYEIGHGVPGGKSLKMVQLGGSSGSFIPADHLDTPIDWKSLRQIGAGQGSGAILVLDETRCVVDFLKNLLKFFNHESCGKCVPCRVGIAKALDLVDRVSEGNIAVEELEFMQNLAQVIRGTSLCGLGQAAANQILEALKYFKPEFISHIETGYCPAQKCGGFKHV